MMAGRGQWQCHGESQRQGRDEQERVPVAEVQHVLENGVRQVTWPQRKSRYGVLIFDIPKFRDFYSNGPLKHIMRFKLACWAMSESQEPLAESGDGRQAGHLAASCRGRLSLGGAELSERKLWRASRRSPPPPLWRTCSSRK